MTKHNVGDKVEVRSDLAEGKYYAMEDSGYRDIFVSAMMRFAGEEVTISEVVNYDQGECYHIAEDEEMWCWTDEMFESE